MTRSDWVTRLFSLLQGLFMQRPLGIPAQAEAPVAPRSWPGTGTSALKPQAAAHRAGCAEQELPSPTASPGQHLYHVLALVSFCSWLRPVQLLADFFPPFFVILKNQRNNHMLIYSHLFFLHCSLA